MEDNYLTLAQAASAEFKEKASKFIAYAFPVTDADTFYAHLEKLKKEHFKANHHCYAFRLGMDTNQFRANDDGEPSGTAGRPILGQIDSFGLTDVGIVVVRYFGGTKLGTSGLIQAYKAAAAMVLEAAQIIEKKAEDLYLLSFDYHLMPAVMQAVKKLQVPVIAQNFDNHGEITIAMGKSEVADTLLRLKALIQSVSLEEAALLKEIHGLQIQYVQSR